MRNLKKVLALTLAIALVLSLSVTAGAVNFSDKDTITGKYQDAVDLMSELSIMNGFPDGTYQPQGELTRAQYLKMLYVVMNRGVDDQAVLYKDVQPFPFYDVRDYDWFNGYVKWGYGRQLIDGYGGGIFKPNGTVTGFEAIKMSLTALGFSSEIEGYTGDAWKTQVLNDAQDAGLLLNLENENLSVNLTREAAAQLLHNTLFSQTVRYNTTYIPAKMEKGQTMAFTYYNLYTLRGVVVANEWASVTSASKSLAGESRIVAGASNIPKDMEGNNIGTGTYDLPYKAPLDMLGKEVVVYVRYANNYTTRPFDKVYGNMLETSRNVVNTYYAEVDVTDPISNNYNSTVKSDLDFYVQHGDFLDSTYGKVSGATVVANYNGNVSSTNKILAGSPITFIDNDNDGDYDYVIALSLTYAKVADVSSDNKVTAYAGDSGDGDFTGKKILAAVAKTNIYNGADLKVDDRILFYPVGDKQGAMLVDPQEGTLTASRSNATIAIISGTEYKESKLDSRVVDLNDILDSENFNVEKEYYFYNSKVLEGTTGTSASKVYALVIDSYTTGSSLVKNNMVKLVLQDGTVAAYNLSAIQDKDGNNMTLSVESSSNNQIKALDKTGSGATIDANFATATPIEQKIFRATISEDEASVTLYNDKLPATTQVATGANARVSYTKGNSNISFTGHNSAVTGLNVLTGTVFFIKNGDDYGAYVGRTLPTTPNTQIDSTELRVADNTGAVAATGTAVAAVFLNGNIPVNAVANKTYGYVLKDPIVKYDSKYYISELVIYNGKEVVTLVGQPGVRSSVKTSAYTTSDINSRDTDLSGTSSSALGIVKGDVVEYTLGADGKVYSLVTLRGSAYSNIGTLYNAYTAVAINRAIDIVNPDNLGAGRTGTLAVNSDTVYYGVDSDAVTGHVLTNLPSDTAEKKGYYIKAIIKDTGVASHVWVLEHKDYEDVNAAITAAGGSSGTASGPSAVNQLPTGLYTIVNTQGALSSAGDLWYNSLGSALHYWNGFSEITVTGLTDADKAFFAPLRNADQITVDNEATRKISLITATAPRVLAITTNIAADTLTIGGAGNVQISGSVTNLVLAGNVNYDVSGITSYTKITASGNTGVITAGTRNLTVDVNGSNTTITQIASAGALTINGASTAHTLTFTNAVNGASMIVNGGTNASATITFSDPVDIAGALTVNGGTVSGGGESKIDFTDTVEAGSLTVLGSAGQIEFDDEVDAGTGNIAVTSGTGTITFGASGIVKGNNLTATANGVAGVIAFSGSADSIEITGKLTLNATKADVTAAGTIVADSIEANANPASSGAYVITVGGATTANTVDINAGRPSGADVTFDTIEAASGIATVSIDAGSFAGNVTLGDVDGDVYVTGDGSTGTFTLAAINKVLTAGGNLEVSGEITATLGGTIEGDVDVLDDSLVVFGTEEVEGLVTLNSTGTSTIGAGTLNDLTVTRGVFAAQAATIGGAIQIDIANTGTVTVPLANKTFTLINVTNGAAIATGTGTTTNNAMIATPTMSTTVSGGVVAVALTGSTGFANNSVASFEVGTRRITMTGAAGVDRIAIAITTVP